MRMKLGFIVPDYPGERRRALLPAHIDRFPNEITIESGYGHILGIEDAAYVRKGCRVASRDEVYRHCDAIMHLKLVQRADFPRIRGGQTFVGWTHPDGDCGGFMELAARLGLRIVDLDNTHPALYADGRRTDLRHLLPRDFVRENSVHAGEAAVVHALSHFGSLPRPGAMAAVLSAGNVAQGAFAMLTRLGATCRMFTRSTMNEFQDSLGEYEIVVNGIGITADERPILTREDSQRLRKGALVIDAAADYDGAIEHSEARPIGDPIREVDGVWYWCVDNIPSLFFREASHDLSRDFSRWVYSRDIREFVEAGVRGDAQAPADSEELIPGMRHVIQRWIADDHPVEPDPRTPRSTARVA